MTFDLRSTTSRVIELASSIAASKADAANASSEKNSATDTVARLFLDAGFAGFGETLKANVAESETAWKNVKGAANGALRLAGALKAGTVIARPETARKEWIVGGASVASVTADQRDALVAGGDGDTPITTFVKVMNDAAKVRKEAIAERADAESAAIQAFIASPRDVAATLANMSHDEREKAGIVATVGELASSMHTNGDDVTTARRDYSLVDQAQMVMVGGMIVAEQAAEAERVAARNTMLANIDALKDALPEMSEHDLTRLAEAVAGEVAERRAAAQADVAEA